VEIIYIPQDKIGEVIGPRGKIIKELVEETGAQIDVDEEGGRGVVKIYATSAEKAAAARDRINAIANPTLPEVGERYSATVVKTVDFGAFVSLTPGTDGLLHISELGKMVGKRLDHSEDAVSVGQQVLVEVKEVLDGGRRFKLEYVGEKAAPAEGSDRPRGGDRGGDRGSDRGERRERSGGDRTEAPKAAEAPAAPASSDAGEGRTRTRSRSRSRD